MDGPISNEVDIVNIDMTTAGLDAPTITGVSQKDNNTDIVNVTVPLFMADGVTPNNANAVTVYAAPGLSALEGFSTVEQVLNVSGVVSMRKALVADEIGASVAVEITTGLGDWSFIAALSNAPAPA